MTKTLGNKIPGFLEAKNYIDLLQAFPPRSIRSEEELDPIQEIIDFFLDKQTRTDNEREYLHLLGLLVQEYEDQHYPIADTPFANVLMNLMEEHKISFSNLSHIFESELDLNVLLTGTQNITLKQIHELATVFHVSATVFI